MNTSEHSWTFIYYDELISNIKLLLFHVINRNLHVWSWYPIWSAWYLCDFHFVTQLCRWNAYHFSLVTHVKRATNLHNAGSTTIIAINAIFLYNFVVFFAALSVLLIKKKLTKFSILNAFHSFPLKAHSSTLHIFILWSRIFLFNFFFAWANTTDNIQINTYNLLNVWLFSRSLLHPKPNEFGFNDEFWNLFSARI